MQGETDTEFNRIIWIILDSVGAGYMPDAADFDDEGADTLGHIFETADGFDLPNMRRLGLGNIDGIHNIRPADFPIGCYGKSAEISNGKDTTIGHWEMTGIYTPNRFPTYPNGFPNEIINEFVEKTKIPGILGNCAASGTVIIDEYGTEHLRSRKPIIYTSADSVFQIACHEDVYTPKQLYELCRTARTILIGENGVARVIARPFIGSPGRFERTANRRDFSLKPQKDNLLAKLKQSHYDVIAVGKIEDIFCGVGITEAKHTNDNMDGVDVTIDYINKDTRGLIFTNLVEFDSKWGHRRDVEGYAQGLKDFDDRLPEIINNMRDGDLLIINSDHGCDPTFKGSDHTREYIPILIYGLNAKSGVNIGNRKSFADIGATIAENFGVEISIGESFLKDIVSR